MNLTGERTVTEMASQDEKDCRLIDALKREGWPAEKILELLKELKR